MNLFLKFYPGDAVAMLAANVLAQIALVVALACAVSLLFARHRAAARHAIWLSALACVLLGPAAAYLAGKSQLPLIPLRLLPQLATSHAETPPPSLAIADTPDSLDEPSVDVRSGAEERVAWDQGPETPNPEIPKSPNPKSLIPNPSAAIPLPNGDSLDATVPAADPADPWRAAIGFGVALWAAGAISLLGRLLHGCLQIARLRRRLKPIDAGRLAILTDVRRALDAGAKARALPPLRMLPAAIELAGPITIGLFRPIVVVPEKLLDALAPDELRDVLVHEFAHAVRRDPLIGFVQRLTAIVYWPYPPVHFLNRRLAWAREEVCDNYVLRQGDAACYAETLLRISQTFFSKPPRPIALGLFHPYGRLEQRVAELLDPRRNVMVRIHRVALTVLAATFSAAVIVVACTRLLHAETPVVPPVADAVPAESKPAADGPAANAPSKKLADVVSLDYSSSGVGGQGFSQLPSGYTIATISGEKAAATEVAVSFACEQATPGQTGFHLVAKDRQGKLHEPADENTASGGGAKSRVVTIVAKFSLPQKDIAKLVVQQSGTPPLPGEHNPPGEHNMVSLPAYCVEPPDILAIELPRMVPLAPHRLDIYDVLQIRATGTLVDQPIDGFFLVEAEGVVTLGPAYGRVRVVGMTIEQAEAAVTKKLEEILRKPEITVQLARTASATPVTGRYLVGPDGTINLRQYGLLNVAGKTVAEIRKDLNDRLRAYLDSPNASVEVEQFNSKAYYVITEGGGPGDNVRRVPITGNDTVLDALSAVGGLSQLSKAKIWVARPPTEPHRAEQNLSVDYNAIVQGSSTATNYQIMPGDRVHVAYDSAAAANAWLMTMTNPNKQPSDAISLNVIRPSDVLTIRAVRALPDQPIDGQYRVRPDGTVNLGSAYGSVNVNGLSVEQAEGKIAKHLREIVKKQIEDDVNVRYAAAAADVAKAEYSQSLDANKKVAGTVPQSELRRRLLEVKKMELALEKARRDAGPTVTVMLRKMGSGPLGKTELPSPERQDLAGQPAWKQLGVELKAIPPEEFRRNHKTRYRGGVEIVAVRPNSPAAGQGIMPGDVLVGMHKWETPSVDSVTDILKRPDYATLNPVKFFILRGDETLYGFFSASVVQR
jgi:polysaccharide biosynthesis/export protein